MVCLQSEHTVVNRPLIKLYSNYPTQPVFKNFLWLNKLMSKEQNIKSILSILESILSNYSVVVQRPNLGNSGLEIDFGGPKLVIYLSGF